MDGDNGEPVEAGDQPARVAVRAPVVGVDDRVGEHPQRGNNGVVRGEGVHRFSRRSPKLRADMMTNASSARERPRRGATTTGICPGGAFSSAWLTHWARLSARWFL